MYWCMSLIRSKISTFPGEGCNFWAVYSYRYIITGYTNNRLFRLSTGFWKRHNDVYTRQLWKGCFLITIDFSGVKYILHQTKQKRTPDLAVHASHRYVLWYRQTVYSFSVHVMFCRIFALLQNHVSISNVPHLNDNIHSVFLSIHSMIIFHLKHHCVQKWIHLTFSVNTSKALHALLAGVMTFIFKLRFFIKSQTRVCLRISNKARLSMTPLDNKSSSMTGYYVNTRYWDAIIFTDKMASSN